VQFPPKQTKLLLETVKWWTLMLSPAISRLGTYLGRQALVEGTLNHEGERPITDCFTEAEIEDMIMERDHPGVVRLRLQADAFFVASALYQINSLLGKLPSQPAWRGDLASSGNKFKELYKENGLGDLRNFIEHADEHIALAKQDVAKDLRGRLRDEAGGSHKTPLWRRRHLLRIRHRVPGHGRGLGCAGSPRALPNVT